MNLSIFFKLLLIGLILFSTNNCARTTLFQAVEKGDIALLKECVSNNQDYINKTNEYGETPIIVSVANGNTQAAKVLIENGADLSNTYSLLLSSNNDMIKLFLEHDLKNIITYYEKKIEALVQTANENPSYCYHNLKEMKNSILFKNKSLKNASKRINQIIENYFHEVVLVGNIYDYDVNAQYWAKHGLEPNIDKKILINIIYKMKKGIKSSNARSFYTLQELMYNAGYYMLSKSQQVVKHEQNLKLFGFPLIVDNSGYFCQKDILYSSKKINSNHISDLYKVDSVYVSYTNSDNIKMIFIKPGLTSNITKILDKKNEPIVRYFVIPIEYISSSDILKNYPDDLFKIETHTNRLDTWLIEKGYLK